MQDTAFHTKLAQKAIRPIDLARQLNVDKATVSRWMHGRIPAERVLAIEQATGISRHELRPDLYPASDEAAA
jgi:DNA-binding transcriptional regulator YdaS (Cro superfamily)